VRLVAARSYRPAGKSFPLAAATGHAHAGYRLSTSFAGEKTVETAENIEVMESAKQLSGNELASAKTPCGKPCEGCARRLVCPVSRIVLHDDFRDGGRA